jgi:hypothetical protein
MGFEILSIDQKQHLNLSDYAWLVIEEDMFNFNQENSKDTSLSGFINQIITNYADYAQCSISIELLRYEKELNDIFLSLLVSQYDSKIQNDYKRLLLQTKKRELLRAAEKYPKGIAKKFRINNLNVEYLEESEDDRFYGKYPGPYIKALCEEYARKTYSERERIYLFDRVIIIENAISHASALRLTLHNGRKFIISPYAFLTDKLDSFNYLVGYSEEIETNESHYRMSSFRLSRIQSIKIVQSKSGKITKRDGELLSMQLSQTGPQFLSSDQQGIVIRLTERGIQNYHQQIHLRPKYIEKIDQNTFVFSCTEIQAIYYFFKFGRDAIVVSPNVTRLKFKRFYEDALSNYAESIEI